MITFGDICGLAFLIAVPVIGIKLYKDHQNDVIGWANNAQRDKEIDDFTQFIISHESANQISVGEIKWYIGKYCETKSASFEEFNAEVEYRMQHPRVNILGDLSNHKRLLDKYKNTENFNEIEFFQELNETLKKETMKEIVRIGFITDEKKYGDFIFEVEFLVSSDMNSGIQFRSEINDANDKCNVSHKKTPERVHGYQMEIDPSVCILKLVVQYFQDL